MLQETGQYEHILRQEGWEIYTNRLIYCIKAVGKVLNNYIAEFYDKTLYFKNKAWPQTGVLLYTGMLSQPMTNWQITPPPPNS